MNDTNTALALAYLGGCDCDPEVLADITDNQLHRIHIGHDNDCNLLRRTDPGTETLIIYTNVPGNARQ